MATSRTLSQKTVKAAVAKAIKQAPVAPPVPKSVVARPVNLKIARAVVKKAAKLPPKPGPKATAIPIPNLNVERAKKVVALADKASELAQSALAGNPDATAATDALLNAAQDPMASPAMAAAAEAAQETLRGGAEESYDYLDDEEEEYDDELDEEIEESDDELDEESDEEDDMSDDDVGSLAIARAAGRRMIGRIAVPKNFPMPKNGMRLPKDKLLQRLKEINRVFRVGKSK